MTREQIIQRRKELADKKIELDLAARHHGVEVDHLMEICGHTVKRRCSFMGKEDGWICDDCGWQS